ncbi:ATP-binding cassette domain-containing protein [Longimicrobium terrae]|uniref:ABC-type multidrug transport system ATPase subunit n=1 Tax=Longimicrobium terrae TaxID=1639882 RepID=A0A841GU49_9BACT|nr:ABC-type multidrug transport system ATPase subunit [Longimicrobium terrae]MBB6068514.1 ABC-type multidrug transport system ATPase subunit [Longimicrobium terrae]NNC27704.1 ATP-binding cassette domain-containing protein [Longimicrobium terrae]
MELKIDRLRKTYPNGVHALQEVSLTIAPGMFGLLGPNGAGKSTLMRILATLQEADGGAVTLGDIDVLRDKDAVRRTLGYLPQEFGLYPRVTAEELLDHFALLKGVVNARERRDTVRSLLEQTNLWDARNRRLGGFSGGMRQRFGIAVALIGNPRLIIVDEPTAGLDPAERVRFLNLLSALGENAVVLLSTHIVEDVSDLCQRMAVIQGGRILLEAVPRDAVAALSGRVWRREVPRDELVAFEEAHPVISTTLVGGQTMVHVVADSAPDSTFQRVQPDLKDVYFTLMRGLSLRSTAQPVALHVTPEPAAQAGVPERTDAPEPMAAPEPIAPHVPASVSAPRPADGADPWATFRRRAESVESAQSAEARSASNPPTGAESAANSPQAGADDPLARFRRPAAPNPQTGVGQPDTIESTANSDPADAIHPTGLRRTESGSAPHPVPETGPSFETVRDFGNTSDVPQPHAAPPAVPSTETPRSAGDTHPAFPPSAVDDHRSVIADRAQPVGQPAAAEQSRSSVDPARSAENQSIAHPPSVDENRPVIQRPADDVRPDPDQPMRDGDDRDGSGARDERPAIHPPLDDSARRGGAGTE